MKHKPNILFIMSDQHRWDTVGIYGNNDIRTPNLDLLGREGTIYTNAYCPYAICAPSRYSLLTGLYVHQHLGSTNHSTLPTGLTKFPRILNQNGYKCTAVGKMHMTPTYLDVGFSTMHLAEQVGPGRYDDDYHRYLADKGLCDVVDLVDQVPNYRKMATKEYFSSIGTYPSDLDKEDYITGWIGRNASNELTQWEGDGNLLFVSFTKPHHPFDPPEPWFSMYNPSSIDVLPGWTEEVSSYDKEYNKGYFDNTSLSQETVKKVTAAYYGSISQIDAEVGKLVQILKDRGQYDNTCIVYLSDHGEYLGFHHMLLKSNHLYDPLAKVPLLIKYPQQYDKYNNNTDKSLINLVDIAPTLCDVAGVKKDRQFVSGLSLITPEKREYVFSQYRTEYMIRDTKHKMLYDSATGKAVVFDLIQDPNEQRDISSTEEGERVADLFLKRLLRFFTEEGAIVEPHLYFDAPQIKKVSNAQHQRQEGYFEEQIANHRHPFLKEK